MSGGTAEAREAGASIVAASSAFQLWRPSVARAGGRGMDQFVRRVACQPDR